jgi:hypothetical protein
VWLEANGPNALPTHSFFGSSLPSAGPAGDIVNAVSIAHTPRPAPAEELCEPATFPSHSRAAEGLGRAEIGAKGIKASRFCGSFIMAATR